VAGYDVYAMDRGTRLATVSGSTLTYEDTNILAQTDYSYTVDAIRRRGESFGPIDRGTC